MSFRIVSFLGAFLLFTLEPMVGKAVLPYFGGGADAWISCLLFFQLVLLAGYAYAHYLCKVLGAPAQRRLHTCLLLLTLASALGAFLWGASPFLPGPGLPGLNLKPPPFAIIVVLSLSSGLGLMALSATSPLVQAWYARCPEKREPYRLYAISNWGSLTGLILYPLVIEPASGLRVQAWLVLALFLIYGVLMWRLSRGENAGPVEIKEEASSLQQLQLPRVPWLMKAKWTGLSALGAVWLLAISGKMSTDVASMPLIWVPPLAVYLLTFVLVFDGRADFTRRWVRLLFAGLILAFAMSLGLMELFNAPSQSLGHVTPAFSLGVMDAVQWVNGHVAWVAGLALAALFASCMYCHGRLAQLKPPPQQLTVYYLCISIGGALGGLLVSVVAPIIFNQTYELPLALMVVSGLTLFGFRRVSGRSSWMGLVFTSITVGLALVKVVAGWADVRIYHARDFFGTVRVYKLHPKILQMSHGTTVHGLQFIDDPLRPVAYYGLGSGFGRAIQEMQKDRSGIHVGIIGLGVGNALAYGRATDSFTVYEISPKIIQISGLQGSLFSVVKSTPAQVAIREGDGRILLAKDVALGERFDVLLVDAFAGGHIPAHLLTQEALRLYLSSLKPGGVMVLHVSHHLPLDRQVGIGLEALGVPAIEVWHPGVVGVGKSGISLYVEMPSLFWLCSPDPRRVFRPELFSVARSLVGPMDYFQNGEASALIDRAQKLRSAKAQGRPWTDDRHSLTTLLY